MSVTKNLLFVINPIAGGREKRHLHRVIERELDHSLFHHEFAYTESEDHARRLSMSAAYLGFDVVAAVGGDGTVNEVARGILQRRGQASAGGQTAGAETAGDQPVMAIIPSGSGNGLARHLGIPMQAAAAVRLINRLHTTRIDAGTMNELPFFCVAGVGFDAHISQVFAQDQKRGFSGYVRSALREIRIYEPARYEVESDGKIIQEKAFLVSIANASQYGNNAYIAPGASTSDGLLDVCILRPFPFYRYPEMALRLMTRRIRHSRYLRMIRGSEITILREKEGPVHLDGEPRHMGNRLDIRVIPSSIPVIVP